jgi:predicted alpha/beta superfamily hydrolase
MVLSFLEPLPYKMIDHMMHPVILLFSQFILCGASVFALDYSHHLAVLSAGDRPGSNYCIMINPFGRDSVPVSSSGRIIRHRDFPSRFVDSRNIDVWLPDGYDEKKKYAVLYMHDGQMLFDSSTTWNGSEWGVDETMSRLLKDGRIRDCIVVGVWNSGAGRHADYFPQQPFAMMTEAEQAVVLGSDRNNGQTVFNGSPVRSDGYLRFLVSELKPFIDKNYSTHRGRKNTFIAGSSMGGLISLYAACTYPDVFGGAACLSTHWPGVFFVEGNPFPAAMLAYLRDRLPAPRRSLFYFDHGDRSLDALYPPFQRDVDHVMRARGYSDRNFRSLFFPGAEHTEKAWASRFHEPLLFLLKR